MSSLSFTIFLDRASFSQWVRSFVRMEHSHPRLPRWIRHKMSLVVRTVRSACLLFSSTRSFTTEFSDHGSPASTTASGVPHTSLPTSTPSNTTYELVYRFASGIIPQDDIPKVLLSIFDARDYQDCMRQLPEQDLRMWVDRSDQVHHP